MKTFFNRWYWRKVYHTFLVARGEKKDKKSKIILILGLISSLYIISTLFLFHPTNIIHVVIFVTALCYSIFNTFYFFFQFILMRKYNQILQNNFSPIEAKENIVTYLDYLDKKLDKERLERHILKNKKISLTQDLRHNEHYQKSIKKNKI